MSQMLKVLCPISALLLLASPAARAEDPAPQVATQTLSPSDIGTMLGQPVVDKEGDRLGPLIDVLVDKDGKPRAAVIDVGGFMGVGVRRIAVAWPLLHVAFNAGETTITEDLPSGDIAAAPEYSGPDGIVIVTGPPPQAR